eukprot:NODE_11114_length_1307_cov_3.244915.p2 GENE.NODE_11114_length_1307_cov_3.244915~~NODE_11114_length_1307_cov_3.244915.p2  ORF type:complete len:260 (-),score=63.86 NODE_11114_length_1307_cov_3.244915:526-1305(-)
MLEGDCFHRHAPDELLPADVHKCKKEKLLAPLVVELVTDLKCANLDMLIHCDGNLDTVKHDAYEKCNNDPLLVDVECQQYCVDANPFEKCVYTLDKKGMFNLSDKTVTMCRLDTTCMSPYVEQHQMYCSGHKKTMAFSPDWKTKKGTHNPHNDRTFMSGVARGKIKDVIFRSRMPKASEVRWFFAFVGVILISIFFCVRSGLCREIAARVELQRSARRVAPRGGVDHVVPPFKSSPGAYVAPHARPPPAATYDDDDDDD